LTGALGAGGLDALSAQVTRAQVALGSMRSELLRLQETGRGWSEPADRLRAAIEQTEAEIARLSAEWYRLREAGTAAGTAGTKALDSMAQGASTARREVALLTVSYDGLGAATRTLAQLEAARWESSRKTAAALMAGTTLNPFGGTIPATGTTATGTTRTPSTIPTTGGNIYGGVNNVYGIPVFQQGGVMPYTGLAHLERGERVLPAAQSAPLTIQVTLAPTVMGQVTQADLRQIGRQLAPAIHDELTRLGR
jgi:hypothetical protein